MILIIRGINGYGKIPLYSPISQNKGKPPPNSPIKLKIKENHPLVFP
jgi:hypothetical protein